MDFTITKTQRDIREEMIAFGRAHLNHDIAHRELTQTFDRNLWRKMGELNIPGLCIPTNYGGRGYDSLTTVLALEALGEGCEDGGLCFALGAHLFACLIPILNHGSEEQKTKYLPLLCDGTLIAGNAMTERDSGSDAYNLKTAARKEGKNFFLSGKKSFVSNGPVADILITYASTNADKGFFGGISAFMLDKTRDTFKMSPITEKMGVRTCQAGEVTFDNTQVTNDALLGKTGGGGMIFNQSMEWERICLGAIHLGAMNRVLKNAIKFVKERQIGGQSIGTNQAISHQLAELKARLESVKLLTYQAAWKLDKKEEVGMQASITKLQVSETFKEFALKIFQIFGGQAYTGNHEAERLLRDAMGSTLYSGTSEIQKNIIAKRMGI